MTTPEVQLAVFGEQGSGKTTLLSSYYGRMQSPAFREDRKYGLLADSRTQGGILLGNYYKLEDGNFPAPSESYDEYRFLMQFEETDEDALVFSWLDYPGGWWTQEASDPELKALQEQAITNLLESHAAILLLDGAKVLAEGGRYMKKVFDLFRGEVKRHHNSIAQRGLAVENYPKFWIIGMSKADLFGEEHSAEEFCKVACKEAGTSLDSLGKELRRIAKDIRIGDQFLLLSSVKGQDDRVVDVESNLGLDLIAPLVLLSAVNDSAKKQSEGKIPGTLAEIVERLKSLLDLVDQLDDFLPPKYQPISKILKALKAAETLDARVEDLRELQREAAKKGDFLKATALAMQAELESPGSQRTYFLNQG